MKKITIICLLFGLLILLALAVTSCPKTGDIEPGKGEVVTEPVGPAVTERETEIPPDAAATPEQLEEAEKAKEAAEREKGAEEGGEDAGEGEGAMPDEGEGEAEDDGEDAGEEATE